MFIPRQFVTILNDFPWLVKPYEPHFSGKITQIKQNFPEWFSNWWWNCAIFIRHLQSNLNNKRNFGKSRTPTLKYKLFRYIRNLSLGEWRHPSSTKAWDDNHYVIQQRYMADGKYRLSITVNGDEIRSVVYQSVMQYHDVSVYFSTNGIHQANVEVRNLKLTNFL